MHQKRITHTNEESESVEEKKVLEQTVGLTWAAVKTGIIKCTTSLPNLDLSLSENLFSKRKNSSGLVDNKIQIRWRSLSTTEQKLIISTINEENEGIGPSKKIVHSPMGWNVV